jgi:hypothetical protein
MYMVLNSLFRLGSGASDGADVPNWAWAEYGRRIGLQYDVSDAG